jgi:DNA-binding HxlR family transcriptional regulator
MSAYGQCCPVAKAMALLDERWRLLVVRELRRGVPRRSPAPPPG